MTKNHQLSREAYAEARARGLPRSEAARAAGSRATRVDTLSAAGGRLEAEEGMQGMIREAREAHIQGLKDDWELPMARAYQVLRDDDLKSMWPKAWDFLAKVDGMYAPAKHDVETVYKISSLDWSPLTGKDPTDTYEDDDDEPHP